MTLRIKVLSILIFSLTTNSLVASISISKNSYSSSSENSLVLQKTKSGKLIQISAGQELKVWHKETDVTQGKFVRSLGGQIIIKSDGVEASISQDDINQIRVVGPNPKLGHFFFLAGGVALALCGISLVAGLASLSSDSIGAIILVAIPVLGGAGFGLNAAGNKLAGKKYNLRKKWTIVK